MLLAVSRVHESVPLFLIEGMKRRVQTLEGKKVAVLGLAFKADTDDERDSLAHKLVRMLERELADVAVHDPVVTSPTSTFDEAIMDADLVVVATNHSEYSRPQTLGAILDSAHRDCLVVDPWNAFGHAQVFAYANEVAALTGA
jgi:UDP-N-acetyl-D-mannosaminuronic acid dehydrogenase